MLFFFRYKLLYGVRKKNNIDFISGFKLFLHQGVEGFKSFSGIEVDGQLIEQKFLENYPL